MSVAPNWSRLAPVPFSSKRPIALLALILAACSAPHHAYRVSPAPERATPVVWRTPEARARDVKLWHDTQLWNDVALWNAVATLHAAEVAQTGCPYAPAIFDIWRADQNWAVTIAMRESRCEPWARNPSGAVGLLQLLGHGDILAAVCPGHPDPGTDPTCNSAAGWRLYLAAGRSPWRL